MVWGFQALAEGVQSHFKFQKESMTSDTSTAILISSFFSAFEFALRGASRLSKRNTGYVLASFYHVAEDKVTDIFYIPNI